MAGTCLIPIDEAYLSGLINVISSCHADNSQAYVAKEYTGLSCCDTCDSSLESLNCLNDILLYLRNIDLNVDDCEDIHKVKEAAAKICSFSEGDIEQGGIEDALLLENGGIIFLEGESKHIELETA